MAREGDTLVGSFFPQNLRMIQRTVTVVIPCFNHGRMVRTAVESALAQRGADVRVVVVEDGSTDGETFSACDWRLIVSRNSPAAGEISAAKSASEILDLPSASRAAVELVATDCLTSASSGNELNSETKLTGAV